jgi:hypothetical protein
VTRCVVASAEMQQPGRGAGLRGGRAKGRGRSGYLATRNRARLVPIVLKVLTI